MGARRKPSAARRRRRGDRRAEEAAKRQAEREKEFEDNLKQQPPTTDSPPDEGPSTDASPEGATEQPEDTGEADRLEREHEERLKQKQDRYQAERDRVWREYEAKIEQVEVGPDADAIRHDLNEAFQHIEQEHEQRVQDEQDRHDSELFGESEAQESTEQPTQEPSQAVAASPPGPKVTIKSAGFGAEGHTLPTLNQSQPFFVVVDVPVDPNKEAPEFMGITLTNASGGQSTLTLKRSADMKAVPEGDDAGVYWVYSHDDPATLNHGATGSGGVSIPLGLGLQWVTGGKELIVSTGDMSPVSIENGEIVTVSWGDVKTGFIAFKTPIQQALFSNETFLRSAKEFWSTILANVDQLPDGELKDSVRFEAELKLKASGTGIRWVEDTEIYDPQKLAFSDAYVRLVQSDPGTGTQS